MKIHVRRRHIDAGRTSSEFCPIALAMAEAGFDRPIVSSTTFVFFESYWAISTGDLPVEARYFVNDFDDGKPVRPFSFKLVLP